MEASGAYIARMREERVIVSSSHTGTCELPPWINTHTSIFRPPPVHLPAKYTGLPCHRKQSLFDSSLFWHMASNQPRSHLSPPGGACAVVQDYPLAPDQYEVLLRTALECTNLLGSILRNCPDRAPEGADTSFRAPALTSSAVSHDQHAPCATALVVEHLACTMQSLITLATRGVIPPADLRDAAAGYHACRISMLHYAATGGTSLLYGQRESRDAT